jgi:hypothetical protein
MNQMESARQRGAKESGAATKAEAPRTFRGLGLEGDEGVAVFKVGGKPVFAVDVDHGTATLTTAAEGPARVVADFESQETLDGIIDGRLHPIVAALQNRLTVPEGDRRFGLNVLLALRAAAPVFSQRGT